MLTTIRTTAAWIAARCRDERAAALIEYALIVALIAVICVAALTMLGQRSNSTFSDAGSSVASA